MKRYSKQSELSLQEATTEELVGADSNERMFKWAIPPSVNAVEDCSRIPSPSGMQTRIGASRCWRCLDPSRESVFVLTANGLFTKLSIDAEKGLVRYQVTDLRSC